MCDRLADYAKDTRVAATVAAGVRACARVHTSNVCSEGAVVHWRDIIGKEWPRRYIHRRVSRFISRIIFMYATARATREGLR